MATTAAIKSIPSKMEDLRKTFDALQSYSSSLASFTLQWKDLEDHFSSIERSIQARFDHLEPKTLPAAPTTAAESPPPLGDETEVEPRPALKSLCVEMNGKGLRSFVVANRSDHDAIWRELVPALRSAPDPAALILEAIERFYTPKYKGQKDQSFLAIRRGSLRLLERLKVVAPEISPLVRDRAKNLALEWKGRIATDGGDIRIEVLAFVRLLLAYGLVSEFETDELLDLLVYVSRMKQTIDLIKTLGLVDSVPDFIEKLSNKGKQFDAIKFVYAFDLLDKYPPVPLLEAYLKACNKSAQEIRKRGGNPIENQNDAFLKEISAMRAIVKTVEEYKLEAQYPCENLQKRIVQLEQHKANKKRAAASDAASSVKNLKQQKSSNKRLRPPTTSAIDVSRHFPSSVPNLGSTDPASYLGLSRSYGVTTGGSLYDRPVPGFSGMSMSLGGNPIPTSHPYSSDSHATSGLHDRLLTYGSYSLSGLPSSYGAPRYP